MRICRRIAVILRITGDRRQTCRGSVTAVDITEKCPKERRTLEISALIRFPRRLVDPDELQCWTCPPKKTDFTSFPSICQFGSTWLGWVRLGSARLGSARLGSARLGAFSRPWSTSVDKIVFNRDREEIQMMLWVKPKANLTSEPYKKTSKSRSLRRDLKVWPLKWKLLRSTF